MFVCCCRLLLCAQSPRFAELIMAQAGPSQVPGGECRWKLTLPDIYPDILGLMLQVSRRLWPRRQFRPQHDSPLTDSQPVHDHSQLRVVVSPRVAKA